jgi:hypothetical protein
VIATCALFRAAAREPSLCNISPATETLLTLHYVNQLGLASSRQLGRAATTGLPYSHTVIAVPPQKGELGFFKVPPDAPLVPL